MSSSGISLRFHFKPAVLIHVLAAVHTGEHTFAWLTDFRLHKNNVCAIASQGGRVRCNIENQGFNIQKNSGLNLEHADSTDPDVMKAFYYLRSQRNPRTIRLGGLFLMALMAVSRFWRWTLSQVGRYAHGRQNPPFEENLCMCQLFKPSVSMLVKTIISASCPPSITPATRPYGKVRFANSWN